MAVEDGIPSLIIIDYSPLELSRSLRAMCWWQTGILLKSGKRLVKLTPKVNNQHSLNTFPTPSTYSTSLILRFSLPD